MFHHGQHRNARTQRNHTAPLRSTGITADNAFNWCYCLLQHLQMHCLEADGLPSHNALCLCITTVQHSGHCDTGDVNANCTSACHAVRAMLPLRYKLLHSTGAFHECPFVLYLSDRGTTCLPVKGAWCDCAEHERICMNQCHKTLPQPALLPVGPCRSQKRGKRDQGSNQGCSPAALPAHPSVQDSSTAHHGVREQQAGAAEWPGQASGTCNPLAGQHLQ